jgi:hypothetical protein
LSAPYLLIKVTLPGMLSGLTTKGDYQLAQWVVCYFEPTDLTVEQLNQFFWLHGRPNLDPDRVLDPPKVFDMGAIELSRSISDPDEM